VPGHLDATPRPKSSTEALKSHPHAYFGLGKDVGLGRTAGLELSGLVKGRVELHFARRGYVAQ